MRMRGLYFWSIVSCTLLVSCGGGSETKSTSPSETTPLPVALQSILDSASNRVDGIVVYVETSGREPVELSVGVQERMSRLPMNPQVTFKIASISKLFIAVAATKLVAEGALAMDDSLASLLPQVTQRIENAEQITLKHLLEHRSGIPDFDSQEGFSWQDPHTDKLTTLELALGKPADFRPNEDYQYSNTNYLLIGLILDRVLGFSHEDYIDNAIIMPLGLSQTYLYASDQNLPEMASGYWQGRDRKLQRYDMPGGSMVSTAAEVGQFIRALNRGNLLSVEERQIYPYFWGHSGWLPGYQSIANYYPDIDTVVVQFVNTTGDDSEAVANDTYERIVQELRRR